MKTSDKKTERNFDLLISKLSENDILNVSEMSNVKGGNTDGEGGGGSPVIIIPKW